MTNLPDTDERGQKTLYVSWSRLYDYEKCHQRGWLHAHGKGDQVKDGRNFIHGTLADRAMRRWLEQNEEQLPGQMAQYVDDAWEEHAIKSPEYKIRWRGDPIDDQNKVRNLAKKVVNNVEPFLIARVLPFEYEPELRFRVPVKVPDYDGFQRTIVLNGGIDIAVRNPENGQVWLYDLKATENERYVQGGIMAQLIFYSVAWTLMMGTSPGDMTAAFLTPACKAQYHGLNITSDDRRHLLSRVVAYAQNYWREEQTPTDDKNECWNCDCKRWCPLFTDKVTVKADGKKRASIADAAQARRDRK